jgi:3-oxoacyl-[acyl-carrier protein] reductase
MDLKDKSAVVTGGGVGTGRAIVLDLAKGGCNVIVNYSKSKQQAEETAEEAIALGVKAETALADVRDDDAVRSMMKQAASSFGRLDILVNNAGGTRHIEHSDLDAVSKEDWDFIMGTNAWGTFQATRAAVPHMVAHDGGSVVNISSIAGVYATGSSVPYCASKAAINNMTVSLARALAPDVRVNAVAPGFIDTRWWSELEHYEVIKQMATDMTPLKDVCKPEDVSKVVVDLATSRLVTGQIVVVDGGLGIK